MNMNMNMNMNYDMGLPPTRNNDYSYEEFSDHAKYADYTKLDSRRPHFYYQAFTDKEEKYIKNERKKSFISRDLYPEFSTSLNETFLIPNPLNVKNSNIQCRFGERGVTVALHYDVGDNIIGMIYGAKRYIILPPNQCSNLAGSVITNVDHPLHRHSPINFGNLKYLNQNTNTNSTSTSTSNMPDPDDDEYVNLVNNITSNAYGIETILKSGEVLFLPSYWFHYIIGLQKNAQCNVRIHENDNNDGEEEEENEEDNDGEDDGENNNKSSEFGGRIDVSSERC
jgi:hypothetical protein